MKGHSGAPQRARHRQNARLGHGAFLVLAIAACSPAAPSTAPSAATTVTVAPSAPPTPTPRPTLPNGLTHRPGLPILVDGEVAGCLPLCATGWSEAGPFGVAERYQTKWFFGGYMTVTPGRPWDGGEDSTGELGMLPPGEPEYGVTFAIDLYPVRDGERVPDVPNTAVGLLGWLRDNDYYLVSDDIQATVGALPAIAVDVRLSHMAPSQYEDCNGVPCTDLFGYEQAEGAGGILGDDVYRYYFADVEYDNTRHVMVIEVEGRDERDLEAFLPAVEELLTTVTVPARIPAPVAPIVGTWHRKQTCDELMSAFEGAGLLASHLDWANDLCTETRVPTEHSHVFTADGMFGSHDQTGQQVDDGTYDLIGDEIRFPKHAAEFGYDDGIAVAYRIDRNVATFDVKVPGHCTGPCGLAYFWALSAFASGPWERAGG